MHRLRWMQKCANANFCNWLVTPKFWIVLGVMAVFSIWNMSGILEYSVKNGIRISPWILPHYFSVPVMRTAYAFLAVALFSDAPFRNPSSQFVEIRTGKRIWIQGQCLFILEASFCYALAYFLLTILLILPRIYVTPQWGVFLETAASDSETVTAIVGIGFAAPLMEMYSPIQATVLTMLFIWLVSGFLGMLILASRIVISENAGNIVAGIVVFISYFSLYLGDLVFGNKIFRLAPVNWVYLGMLGNGVSSYYPDKIYAVSFLILGILLCAFIGIRAYEWKDMD